MRRLTYLETWSSAKFLAEERGAEGVKTKLIES